MADKLSTCLYFSGSQSLYHAFLLLLPTFLSALRPVGAIFHYLLSWIDPDEVGVLTFVALSECLCHLILALEKWENSKLVHV